MILIEFLLAPTVPSEPRPKNMQRTVSTGSTEKDGSNSRLVCETSSLMPTVKWFLGSGFFNSSSAALSMAGVNSLDDRP